MEKETEKSTYVLDNGDGIGSVKIANDVVAMIAGIAATEVEGVCSMVGNITNEIMGKVGVKKLTKGVKVDVIGKTVRADLSVTLQYGYSIPVTSKLIQEKVKTAIESMTGLEVTDVNVRIAAVEMRN